MSKILSFSTDPKTGYDAEELSAFLNKKYNLPATDYRIVKRSIDARKPAVKVNLQIQTKDEFGKLPELLHYKIPEKDVSNAQPVAVIGSGPAGLFAALQLIEKGLRPIVIEQGQDVRARRRDLAAINKEHKVNPLSNYCFGEGGAGTYSDGKLYTRSKKRGDFQRILEIFVAHGADPAILYESHPHIGTNKLPKIIEAIRETIRNCGGEVRFNTRLTDLLVSNSAIKGVLLNDQEELPVDRVILATGHSARDIFRLLQRKKIKIEAKPFALGVRVEHPQSIINEVQYHNHPDRGYLPAAAYSLVTQTNFKGSKKGVFSFCMCPGGFIVPSATSHGEVVVNGMSPSRRNSKYANSGIVVSVDSLPKHWYKDHGDLAHLAYQEKVEKSAGKFVGHKQSAPGQRLTDFIRGKVSADLPETSYQPGLIPGDLFEVLPYDIGKRLQAGLKVFSSKLKGFYTEEANLVGVESRTSSPVRIPRDAKTMEHPEIKGLYPCGEGGGYAGGIASAAIDGQRVAESIAGSL